VILYLILNLGSPSLPLIYSFHPKIQFYKKWKSILIALAISSLIYIVWDIFFTKAAIWGFNQQYLIGWYLFDLPIEEYLFFICIPFACLFTHYTLLSVFPNFHPTQIPSNILSGILVIILAGLIISNVDKAYTLVNASMTLGILLISIITINNILPRYYLSFIVLLLPFLLVNGILTGSFISGEVVWYNNSENLGIRFFTIPVEDIFYAFGLILLNILIIEHLDKFMLLNKDNKKMFKFKKLIKSSQPGNSTYSSYG